VVTGKMRDTLPCRAVSAVMVLLGLGLAKVISTWVVTTHTLLLVLHNLSLAIPTFPHSRTLSVLPKSAILDQYLVISLKWCKIRSATRFMLKTSGDAGETRKMLWRREL